MPQCFGTDIEGPGSDLSLHGSSLIDRAKPGHPLTSTLSMTDSTGRTLQLYNCSVPHYFSEVWPLFSGFIWFYMVLYGFMPSNASHEYTWVVPSPGCGAKSQSASRRARGPSGHGHAAWCKRQGIGQWPSNQGEHRKWMEKSSADFGDFLTGMVILCYFGDFLEKTDFD